MDSIINKEIQFVEKRDKSIAQFDITRIQNAIFSAARSVGGDDEVRAKFLSELVADKLNQIYVTRPPNVEEIQDIVESVLMQQNHTKTARAYMRYRDLHSKEREDKKRELLEKIDRRQATITNDQGQKEAFDMTEVISEIGHYTVDLPNVDATSLVKEAVSNHYDGITVKELEKSLINAARARIELNPQYSFLASRLILKGLYQSILGNSYSKDQLKLKNKYRESFVNYIDSGIAQGILDKRLKEFNLDKISKAILPNRDLLFHFRGLQTIADRYLLKGIDSQTFELPQYMWMRVALGLSVNEAPENKEAVAISFYNMISEMLYMPSTPTLFNAGTTHPQLSSCFLNTVGDSLQDIFKSYADNAMLSKYAGGLGTDWTNVRSLGSRIEGTNGVSNGVIPFLKIFNDVALAVNQGGKRKGAMCAYLEFWHADIYEFIEAKKNTGDERRRLHDCHTAVWVPDLFMKRMEADENWSLFSPNEVPELHDLYGQKFEERYIAYEQAAPKSMKQVSAKSLWRKLLTMTFETGHPWITFKDPCNIRNPQKHAGVIHNSNLCTEITLNNSEDETAVCNLGSINLSKFVNSMVVDYKLLEQTVTNAIRMLDNVIDINFYPTKEAKNSNLKHRPIGLGVMGYQDALYKMNLPFDCQEHLIFADELMEKISYFAINASANLAKERGAYESYNGSLWSQGIFPYDTLRILDSERQIPVEVDRNFSMNWDELKSRVKKYGMRNSNCMAIAPTATISNICGVYPSIEPVFRNIYVKENTDGSFIVVNQYLAAELDALGLWDEDMVRQIKINDGSIQSIDKIPPAIRRKYKETFEIEPSWLIKAAARRSKWIDQSQSLNIFLPQVAGKTISDIYALAWKTGLKTTYYLRTLSASQVSKTIVDNSSDYKGYKPKSPTPVEDFEIKTAESTNSKSNVTMASPETLTVADTKIKDSEIKLCKIDDPDCEACQ